ncbi:MAG: preprotein translocase subunit SecY [Clostridia bacterium]|nr:preprotein translocase subunit SecY [Clostridia bacterium]
MFKTLMNAFAEKGIRKKMLMTLFVLLIYRIGCFIPIPGIEVSAVSELLKDNTFFQVLSTITGGSLANGTLFALGIVPFINAFIIMQLLTLVIPPLERLSKEGEEGKKKITQITRYAAIILSIVQGIGIVIAWNNNGNIMPIFGMTSPVITMMFIICMLTAGSCFVMWLGERITEYGIGNGTSLLIFIGILSGAGTSMLNEFTLISNDPTVIWRLMLYMLVVVLVFLFIIFVDLAQRNITVQYAKQIKGNKMYGGQSTHIPIRVNASGVMPIIFASAFLMFPQMIASFWPQSGFYIFWSKWLGVGSWVYAVVMSVLILFFAFFYAKIQFNPEDIAKSIQQNGGFIPGIRPGRPTSEYLGRINNRITLFGAIFLAIIALIPGLVFTAILTGSSTLVNAFSATGMLIVVSVALEFNKQLENQLMMKHYRGFLK